jgi:hypothetical protein
MQTVNTCIVVIRRALLCSLVSLCAISGSAQTAPQSLEEQTTQLMRGEPYGGPTVTTPRDEDGKPDFTGLWRPLREPGKPGGNLGKDEPKFALPFTEQGRRALIYTQNHTVDPEALCILGGIPRHNGSGLPFEVLQTPQRIAFTYLYNTSRLVSIGAKPEHETQAPPTYFGSSAAHWEQDTLVIETSGLRDSAHDRIWLDENGNPTSDQTRVVERWSRPDFHHFHLEMTVTDPKYYTRPFRFTRTWIRAPKGLGQQEYACNESNVAADQIGPGAGVIGPDGNRGYGYTAPLPEVPPGPEAYSR